MLFYHITTVPLSPRSCRGEFLILLYNDKVLGAVGDFRPINFFYELFYCCSFYIENVEIEESFSDIWARVLASLNFRRPGVWG
jgi:hypothetical protein